MAGTHLYGRRLVVEWADADEAGLDELRAKTAARFRPEEGDEERAAAGLQQHEEERQPAKKKRRKALEFV